MLSLQLARCMSALDSKMERGEVFQIVDERLLKAGASAASASKTQQLAATDTYDELCRLVCCRERGRSIVVCALFVVQRVG